MKRYELISKDKLFLKDNKKNEIKEVCFGGLDIINLLNEQDKKWQKLKEWLEEMIKKYEPTYDEWMALKYDFYNKTKIQSVYKNILDKMQELEGEDEI